MNLGTYISVRSSDNDVRLFQSLDGYPLPSLVINEARASFGLVSQEPVLFDRSIRGNIAYGDNSRQPTDEEIYSAARQANIHEFIASLPMVTLF